MEPGTHCLKNPIKRIFLCNLLGTLGLKSTQESLKAKQKVTLAYLMC